MLIGNSIRRWLLLSLPTLIVFGTLIIAAEDENFQMINLFEELEKNENYSRVSWYVASERSSVECGGVFKRLQSEILSPGYPGSYGDNLYCEYTFKSPFVCSSQYHFQFLDFGLEPSRNCYKDRFVVGDDEVLCGSVIGSKKYNSTNGILKVKFVTDGWGHDRGFRIVVTRQPCDETVESSTAYTVYTTIQVAEETTMPNISLDDGISPPQNTFAVSNRQDIPPEFNPGNNGYLPPVTTRPPSYPGNQCLPPCYFFPSCYPQYPGPGGGQQPINPSFPNYPSYPNYPSIPSYPVNPTYPSFPGSVAPPTNPSYPYPIYPTYPNTPTFPNPNYPNYPTQSGEGTNSIGGTPPGHQSYPEHELAENATNSADQPQHQWNLPPQPVLPVPPRCCRNVYNQKRFYLVSPNFPSDHTVNRDCFYEIHRYSPNTCRLIISFKFFLLGDERSGCGDAFLELDGRRICGCRTGMVYTSQWGNFPKMIRVHSRSNRFTNVQGYVLDIYQEACPYRYVRSKQPVAQDRIGYIGSVQQLAPVNVTTVLTNSSSLYTYYYYNMDQQQQPQAEQTRLAPTVLYRPISRFYYANNVNSYRSCSFSGLDWLRLKVESLWIAKPGSYPGNQCLPPCYFFPSCYPQYPGPGGGQQPINPSFPNYPSYPNYPSIPSYPVNPTYPSFPGSVAPPTNPSYPYPIYPTYPNTPTFPNPNYPNYPTQSGEGTNSIGGTPPGHQSYPEHELAENATNSADQPQHQWNLPPQPVLPVPPRCCRNVYNQKRFYLVSPNFPSDHTVNRDCFYEIHRYSPNTCRLIISFKFFLLGDERSGCGDAFLELDGRRICGCRTGMVYTSQWGNFPKMIRVHSRSNRFTNVQGYVLDIYQEACPYRYVRSQQPVAQDRIGYIGSVQQLAPVNVTTVLTNSSSLYTYYYYDMDQQQQPQAEQTRLAPTVLYRPISRFYYANNVNSYRSCSFSGLDWLRLKVESLWIAKPGCY
ncbi:uncharacterized protein LOC129728196 [Wyeomyia smithii]|uniref:uncharacterized protein LOC129728196 n=1 Tax=Wyeomyia smithii TaxID=174621 RepID=UPI0024680E17|nr:uncharacterized protein LOC129728196 [Wyeomyia smithii]